jgi:hypothetical protein
MLSDNSGGNTSPHPNQSQPVISQTAQKLTQATAGTDTTATVTAGARYRFTAQKTGGFVFGLATVATGSEANIRWCAPLYQSVELQIPLGQTTLHYTTDTNSGVGYLVEIKQDVDEDPYA